MRKIKYSEFTPKGPCQTPAMSVKVMVSGKQVEQFDVPPGFQLDLYVGSEHPNAEMTVAFSSKHAEHGGFTIEVYDQYIGDMITSDLIAAMPHLAEPDITYIGEYKSPMSVATRVRFQKINAEVKKAKIEVEFDDDDVEEGGHC